MKLNQCKHIWIWAIITFINNIKTPTANDQAGNKSYVDTSGTNIMNAASMIHARKASLLNQNNSEAAVLTKIYN